MTTSVFETDEGAEKAKPINEAVVDHNNKIKPKTNPKFKKKNPQNANIKTNCKKYTKPNKMRKK